MAPREKSQRNQREGNTWRGRWHQAASVIAVVLVVVGTSVVAAASMNFSGFMNASGGNLAGTFTISGSGLDAAAFGSSGGTKGVKVTKGKIKNSKKSSKSGKGKNGGGSDAGQANQPIKIDITTQVKGPKKVQMNPVSGRVLVDKAVNAYVDVKPQTKVFPVGPIRIVIGVKPQRFEWNWGDGQVSTTRSSGAKWPQGSVRHTYHKPGNYQIQCRVYWKGAWVVEGLSGLRISQPLPEKSAAPGKNASPVPSATPTLSEDKKSASGTVNGSIYTDAKSRTFTVRYAAAYR
ncbi:PKD domain-containing protein [Mobiluncus mulieris]|uniref:PKD domain-containing protein n=1 Tax=Mobiluncus mulieris TaxID=2052 RepID=UPI0021E50FEB|nr:PKD domain-containing protein [Mobiluncus mulieris]MCU9974335.1 hypothetical protein [Mobiluncus mulieris]